MIDDKLKQPLDVINAMQQEIWNLHHKVKQYDGHLAVKFWECSLQIESALLKINEDVLGNKGYYDPTP